MSGSHLISIDELKELAAGQVQSLCAMLLPNGRRNGQYWETGSIEDDKGDSLKVNLTGAAQGLWTDFAAPPGAPDRGGNMVQLWALVRCGGDIKEAIKALKIYLGLSDADPATIKEAKAKATRIQKQNQEDAQREAEKNRRRAHQLYLSAVPIEDTIAETYLKSRAIDLRAAGLEIPGSLRFHPEVYCTEKRAKLPAMVATIVGLDGLHRGTHRTWLQADGSGKALLVEAKKSYGKYWGGFIPLWKGKHKCAMKDLPPGTKIYVSEGIEDGLSWALALPEERVIAAVALGNIGALELPPKCPVYILGQRDEKQRAIEAFGKAVEDLQARGYAVFLVFPPKGVKDYNDVLRAAAAGAGGV